MSKGQWWQIELKQVSNGYLLTLYDRVTYKTQESIYSSVKDAVTALNDAANKVAMLQLTAPEEKE